MVNFADFDGVVSKVVVHDEGQILAARVEAQDLAVIVQELLLGRDLSASKTLFEEFLHFSVSLGRNFFLRCFKVVMWGFTGWGLLVADSLDTKLRTRNSDFKRLNSN